jgi:hypothetical protein
MCVCEPLQAQQVALLANAIVHLTRRMYDRPGLTPYESRLLQHYYLELDVKIELMNKEETVPSHNYNYNYNTPQALKPVHMLRPSSTPPTYPPVVSMTTTSPIMTTTSPSAAQATAGRTKKLFHNRTCKHCHTRCTSQWRTGPTGPSTYVFITSLPSLVKHYAPLLADLNRVMMHRLCNACGIRFRRSRKPRESAKSLCSNNSGGGGRQSVMSATANTDSPRDVTAQQTTFRGSIPFLLN